MKLDPGIVHLTFRNGVGGGRWVQQPVHRMIRVLNLNASPFGVIVTQADFCEWL